MYDSVEIRNLEFQIEQLEAQVEELQDDLRRSEMEKWEVEDELNNHIQEYEPRVHDLEYLLSQVNQRADLYEVNNLRAENIKLQETLEGIQTKEQKVELLKGQLVCVHRLSGSVSYQFGILNEGRLDLLFRQKKLRTNKFVGSIIPVAEWSPDMKQQYERRRNRALQLSLSMPEIDA